MSGPRACSPSCPTGKVADERAAWDHRPVRTRRRRHAVVETLKSRGLRARSRDVGQPGRRALRFRRHAPSLRRRCSTAARISSAFHAVQSLLCGIPGSPVLRPAATILTASCSDPCCWHSARNVVVRATDGNSLTSDREPFTAQSACPRVSAVPCCRSCCRLVRSARPVRSDTTCRVDDWRGGGRRMGVAVPGGFRPSPVPHSPPWLRFQSPLIEPDGRISRIRLSDEIMPSPTGGSSYACQGG